MQSIKKKKKEDILMENNFSKAQIYISEISIFRMRKKRKEYSLITQ